VGPEGSDEAFVVQEALVCAGSIRINECLPRPCKESVDRCIQLRDFDPDSFRMFLHFLDTGLIFTIDQDMPRDAIEADSLRIFNEELARCMRIYKLADHLEAQDFKDAIIDAVIEIVAEHRSRHPDTEVFFTEEGVKFLYRCSTRGSPVRRFVVDWGILALDHTGYDPHKEFHDDDQFLCDLYVALRPFWIGEKDATELRDPFGAGCSCIYHEHWVLGKPCYRDRFGS
jgi:hypothetical protein